MAWDAVGYPGRGQGTESHVIADIAGIAGIAVIGKAKPYR
jgi:RPA family protein